MDRQTKMRMERSAAATPTPIDNHGHVKIEVDMEIADNDRRAHRCCFYVSCELGQIERFGQSLVSLISEDEEVKVSLIK